MRIGDIEPNIQKKGKNESFCNAKEGETYWTIKLDSDSYYDTLSQDNATILSLLSKIYYKNK